MCLSPPVFHNPRGGVVEQAPNRVSRPRPRAVHGASESFFQTHSRLHAYIQYTYGTVRAAYRTTTRCGDGNEVRCHDSLTEGKKGRIHPSRAAKFEPFCEKDRPRGSLARFIGLFLVPSRVFVYMCTHTHAVYRNFARASGLFKSAFLSAFRRRFIPQAA
jgi:hypothetical protein